ncbi:MAG: 3-isopropylmalate dehydrogenase [Acidobacteriia bacterium]|nr:3-isopropylmalate dehydrogenase [Terriglobia bacterium]
MRTKLNLAVLPGDGIGVEVTREAVRVLSTVADVHGYDFQFRTELVGGAAIRETGYPLPQPTLEACLSSDAVLLGAVGGPEFDALPPDRKPESGLLALRRELGAFANLRPASSHRAIEDCSPLRPEVVRGADILVVRELLGGLYFGEPRGFTAEGSAGFNTMRYSTDEVERIARIAFEQARARRQKVTSVDKANVLETSQLWRKVVTRVAREFPGVALDHMYVDACAMHLVSNPSRFDVILTENLFGDILSDESAAIGGSLGMLASASVGGRVGLFEPVHGSAPDIAGRGIANPLGAIATAALLLRYAAEMEREARDVEEAIGDVLNRGFRTADLVRDPRTRAATTEEMGVAVAEALTGICERRHAFHAV